jgi:hypothetical protein
MVFAVIIYNMTNLMQKSRKTKRVINRLALNNKYVIADLPNFFSVVPALPSFTNLTTGNTTLFPWRFPSKVRSIINDYDFLALLL